MPNVLDLRMAGAGSRTLSPQVASPSLGIRRIVIWWAASRALVLVSAVCVQAFGIWRPAVFAHPFAVLGSWDGRWYGRIASGGYLLVPGHYSDPAFFPLLPIFERFAADVGVSPVFFGALVANVGFLCGLIAVYTLGREYLPDADARRAALYLAIFPFGFVFSMAYPEGVVLPLVALAGLFALRDRWLAAALCAACATLGRPEGVLLAVPLAAVARSHWHGLDEARRTQAVAAVLAGPAALASFSAYLWRTIHNPLAWSEAEHAWGRSFSPNGVYRAFADLASAPKYHNSWLFRDAAFCFVYLVLLAVAYKSRLPRSWIVAGLGMITMPLASGSFTSDARFGLLAVPVFWALAIIGRRPWANRLIIAVSPLLLVAGVFTTPLRFP